MGNRYYPDYYTLLRVTVDGTSNYRVFGSWGLTSSAWRINSGIERYERAEDGRILFYGYSGSVYSVLEEAYGMTTEASFWLKRIKTPEGTTIEHLSLEEFEKEWAEQSL